MLCPECHRPNPDDHRFCGFCGHKLPVRSNYPREGYDDGEEPVVSELGPEIVQVRRDLPPVAGERTTPRTERLVETMPRPEAPRAPQTTEPMEVPRQDILREQPPASPTPIAPPPSVAPPASIANMWSLNTEPSSETPEEAELHRRSLHGPSFLGLGEPEESSEETYLYEDAPSHTRRNWLLAVLLVLAVLALAQWRSIRDTGLRYAQNGVMKIKLPLKKGSAPADSSAANTAQQPASAANTNGAPSMEVEPTQTTANPSGQNSTNNATEGQSSDANKSAANTTPPPSSPVNAGGNASPAQEASAAPAGASPDDASESESSKAAGVPSSRASNANVPGRTELAQADATNDPAESAKWLWRATSKGNPDAPVRLADMYANGRGVPKDCEQAVVLLRGAAAKNNARAQSRLGTYFATGQCVAQDRSQAWHWLSLAHQTDPNSQWIDQYRQRLWSQMTPDERARAGSNLNATE